MYLGLVQLGSALTTCVVTRNTSNTPIDPAAAPAYRIYGPGGLMTNGTGTLLSKDPSSSGGTITGATNASPIVITVSAAHNLTTGTRVTIASVGGNTAANGDFTITNLTGTTFSLDGSSGNGAYTSGGNWHAAGLYSFSVTPTAGNGYASGINYSVLVSYTISSTAMAQLLTFTVV